MHFHEVHEIIIFEEIDGIYFYNQGQSTLKDSDIVFTPSLETHDFELADKPKSWFIIQFLPSLLDEADLSVVSSFYHQGLHLRLDAENRKAVSQQVAWLFDSYRQNPHSVKSRALLNLLLIWLAEHAKPVVPPNIQTIKHSQGYERLQPVIELFRYNSSVELNLESAAELCNLSPSYFSRLFKRVFRCNFSEYLNQHRLYSAARMLGQSKRSITDISFELNFSSPSHFIALFRRQFGMTPKKYRAQLERRIVFDEV